ncbi:MAG: polysaccharide deacetylase family protein [Clostridiales bacterium]|nr:polysaccharide deacetylase family protein [Clostridiales bacterium]
MKKFSLLIFLFAACLLLLVSCKKDAENKNSESDTAPTVPVQTEPVSTVPTTEPTTTEPTDSPVIYDENGDLPAAVMYHLIMEEPFEGNPWPALFVRPGDFEDQIKALIEEDYVFLFANDYRKTQQKSIMITFDDGYLDNYTTMFPIIKKYNVKVTIFLITDMIGHPEHMTEEQIKEMADSGLVKFESHTATHPSLPNLNEQQLIKEFEKSITKIEELTGQKVTALAYPGGKFDQNVIDVAERYFKYCYLAKTYGQEGFTPSMAIPRYYAARDMSTTSYLQMIKKHLK